MIPPFFPPSFTRCREPFISSTEKNFEQTHFTLFSSWREKRERDVRFESEEDDVFWVARGALGYLRFLIPTLFFLSRAASLSSRMINCMRVEWVYSLEWNGFNCSSSEAGISICILMRTHSDSLDLLAQLSSSSRRRDVVVSLKCKNFHFKLRLCFFLFFCCCLRFCCFFSRLQFFFFFISLSCSRCEKIYNVNEMSERERMGIM